MTYSDLAILMLKTNKVNVAVSDVSEQDAIESLVFFGGFELIKYGEDGRFYTSSTVGWTYAVPILPSNTPLRIPLRRAN